VHEALHQDRRDRVDLLVGVDPGHVELVLPGAAAPSAAAPVIA
jgi:hypothetical protein